MASADCMEMETETVPVSFTVLNARPAGSKVLFVLVDVEMQIAGVAFTIFGVQARREPEDKTSIRLPAFKDPGGTWRPAIQVPEEMRGQLADAVLTFLMEKGLAKRRFEPAPT